MEIPEAAKDAVENAVAPLRAEFPKARWAPRENWHVTLKFLGQTWPRLEGWVRARVGEAAAGCVGFDSKLEGVGSFPSPRKARVVWAGLDDRAGRMAEIAHALDAALADEFKIEKRAFTPHVTVARSEPPLSLPASFGDIEVEPVGFRVERLTLFRSHLRRPAPRYEPLGSFPLGG